MKAKQTAAAMILASSLFGAVVVLPGCSTTPPTEEARDSLMDDSNASLADMKRVDVGMDDMLKNSIGYVIFPAVGKGAVGVGGAYGRGLVYDHGKFVGYADLSQGTVGVQLGGQSYSELIVFQTQSALDGFKNNKLQLEASASAVAMRAGASADAKYVNGVAIFTRPVGGLMFEAAVGGQQFTFTAK
jgi:lipid-binding SYLF domain-containing protein